MTGIVLVVVAGSWCTYRVIETPFIEIGKALIRQRLRAVRQGLSWTDSPPAGSG